MFWFCVCFGVLWFVFSILEQNKVITSSLCNILALLPSKMVSEVEISGCLVVFIILCISGSILSCKHLFLGWSVQGLGEHLQPIVRPGMFLYGDCDFDEELFVAVFDNV